MFNYECLISITWFFLLLVLAIGLFYYIDASVATNSITPLLDVLFGVIVVSLFLGLPAYIFWRASRKVRKVRLGIVRLIDKDLNPNRGQQTITAGHEPIKDKKRRIDTF